MRYAKLDSEELQYFGMRVYGYRVKNLHLVREIEKRAGPLSPQGKQRLKVIDWHLEHGKNLSRTARHFALDRKTLRRWIKRQKEEGNRGLTDRSHRPRSVRKPLTPAVLVNAILKLRKAHPTWSKYKLYALLKKQGFKTCTGTIGRVLKRYGMISEKVSRKRQRAATHPKKRYPRGLVIKKPGDLIQMDTKHTGYVNGHKTYQFTAIDILSRVRVLDASFSISSKKAAEFFQTCQREFPFSIRAVQHDNGSEFRGHFEKQLAKLKIPQYFTHVCSPKENSYVERSHRTDDEEFYDQVLSTDLRQYRRQIKKWQSVYNQERPHQSLGQRSPYEYLQTYHKRRIPTRDYVVLQT